VTETADPAVSGYQLGNRYELDTGRVFVSGVQALARLPLEQMRVDRSRGLNTAAFVSGYPGSPLAGFDREADVASRAAGSLTYIHRHALNEELAATAVMGSQLAAERSDCRFDGITGYWYGKTPGVDRASDALRHAMFAGVHRDSGAVAFVGDDGAAKSSTLPSSSDAALIGLHMPILTPGDVQDALDLGRHAVAMSRASGLWSAVKIVAAVADGTGTLDLALDRVVPIIPQAEYEGRVFVPHADGELLTPHTLDLERELFEVRLELARQYGADNKLNTIVVDPHDAWIGIAACGHTYHELRQALTMLGLKNDQQIADAGIRLLQLRLPSPIDSALLRRFAVGLAEILVVEDKNPTLELLLKEALWSAPDHPLITGKTDDQGRRLLAPNGSLDADAIVAPLRARLAQRLSDDRLAPLPANQRQRALIPLTINRTPYFCSGCPHNVSTEVPDGSLVGGGIGCHSMVAMMDSPRVGEIVGLTCMGNEGAQWVGMAPFIATPHLIQNLGDGTYAHSGQLAVRWAVATGVNITYKILVNGVVAMTGGQDPTGAVDVPTMARILLLQGVRRVMITTDNLGAYNSVSLPDGVEVWDRTRVVEAQERLAAIEGVTVLLHDQACAAEKRRLRKRDRLATPVARVIINERVCEGCGDCGQVSNCLSVQPVETAFGRKTRIDQSSCNLDYSCIRGDCPSFATVIPPKRAGKARRRVAAPPTGLPEPTVVDPGDGFMVRMPGIGGTGVVTVSQLIGTAAMLDGFQVRGLDQTGLSQKAGPVVSDISISRGEQVGSNKAAAGGVDVMLAFDMLGAASDAQLGGASAERTVVIGSASSTPTGKMVLNPSVPYPEVVDLERRLDACSRAERNRYAPVAELVAGLFGDTTTANVFLLGVAHQAGVLPLSTVSLERAIALNGVAVERNLAAFAWGRQWIIDAASVEKAAGIIGVAPTSTEPVDVIAMRSNDLGAYQSSRYARLYLDRVDAVRAAGAAAEIVDSFAVNLYKLMAYKDEYEVARLLLAPEARAAAEAVGGAGARVQWQLHPPMLRALGMKNKLTLGRWATPLLVALRAGRRLRGTPFDVPGWSKLRRIERSLADEYVEAVTRLLRDGVAPELVLQFAELPDLVRGYESIKLANVAIYRDRLTELVKEALK
jgi:indolepyruvate ferredoxin oxidoreductase